MTKGSYKEECQQVINDLTKQHGKKSWWISAYMDQDDHGVHVVVKVNKNDVTREKVRHPNNTVKVCIYLMDKTS